MRVFPLLGVVVALLLAAPAQARPIHIRGTAYEFNAEPVLSGATIKVAELPRAQATTKDDGTYDLVVPDRTRVTPYIVIRGYHTIYLQTFTTRGEDLANVNFQTPTEDIFKALASLLNVPLDANGDVAQCAIVSTFNTRNVRDLTYQQFRDYGAHGVPGATAFGVPPLPPAVYFNSQVIPDPSQPVSSDDGGVVWTNVPAGTYVIRAQAAGTRFASFVANCAPGRAINANPPWGLYQLSPASPAKFKADWNGRTLRSLKVTKLPPQSTITSTCTGRRCPFRTKTTSVRGSSATPLKDDTFAAGSVLEVTAFSHAYNGATTRFTIGTRSLSTQLLCVPDGFTRPQRHCQTG